MEPVFRVLICDDSLLIRRKLKEGILLCCGYAQIFEASDGIEAVRMYKLHRPDLVFMDIILPGKNGIEVVKDIKDFDKKAEIVMVSSVGTKANLFKAFAAGAYDFIQKPWEQNVIDRIILKYIPELDTQKHTEEATSQEDDLLSVTGGTDRGAEDDLLGKEHKQINESEPTENLLSEKEENR